MAQTATIIPPMRGTRTDLVCPDCGGKLLFKRAYFGVFYGCENYEATGCRGKTSAHQATGEPMGVPANAATRQARIEAHAALDSLWTNGDAMTRHQAYKWMRDVMNLSKSQAHISRFDERQCAQLVTLVKNRRHIKLGGKHRA